MGTLFRPRLSPEQIVDEYNAGKTQAWIGLKARLSSVQVRAILVAHGVRIRQSPEALRLNIRSRRREP